MHRAMKRALLHALLVSTLAWTAAAALREDIGDAKATAIERAFAAAIPGSTLEWDETLTVKLADGARSAVRVTGPEEFGTMYVLHAAMTDFAGEAVAHARTFSKEPAPVHPADFLAAVPASGTPRIVRLDPTSISVEIRSFDVVPEYEVPQTWPAVNVTYWAHYATSDWAGSVRWKGVYDVETRKDYMRMPLGIAKKRASGEGIAEPVVPIRASEEIVEVEGGQTRQIVQLPCPMPCTFDGKSLLAAWSVQPGAVLAEE
jgi:hypothetical protein